MPAGDVRHYGDIQWLRGIAALLVVFEHLKNEMMFRLQDLDPAAYEALFIPFAAGVDIFFVISGFVIAHSSRRLFGQPGAWRLFLARRLARIAPLYWLLTLAFLVLLVVSGSRLVGQLDPAYLAGSFLFVPVANGDGVPLPILPLGWTLNYEMMFYALFALVLWLPRTIALPILSVLIAGIVLAGQIFRPESLQLRFWCDPIILEFLAGIAIQSLCARGLVLPGLARVALAAAGVAILVAVGLPDDLYSQRWILWGGPASLIVLAAAAGNTGIKRRVGDLAGDTSYAVYLVHLFVLIALTRAFLRLGWTSAPAVFLAYPVLALTAIGVSAFLLHRLFERPVLSFLRTRIEPSRSVVERPTQA